MSFAFDFLRARSATTAAVRRCGLLAAALVLSIGCSDDDDGHRAKHPPASPTTTGAGSTSTTGSGGEGGFGVGGAGGGTGATGGGGGSGGMATGEPVCAKDTAFIASGQSAVFPTPKGLAAALDELTYDPTAHPLTILLLASKGPASAKAAVSATESGPNGESFPDAHTPEVVTVALEPGKISVPTPQTKGWLRVVDDTGPIDIELENIVFVAQTDLDCTSAIVTLDAVIPKSQGSIVLTVGGASSTIEELAGAGGERGWLFKSLFQAESAPFDFASFP